MLRQFSCFMTVALASTYIAAQAPAGWKTLRSVSKPPATMAGPVIRDGPCSIAVPADWIEDKTTDRSQAHSPDGRARAFIQQWPAGPHYPTFLFRRDDTLSGYRKGIADNLRVDPKATTEMQVLENTPTRLKVKRVSAAALASGGVTDWTLLTAGDPICYAMITVGYTDPSDSPADRAAAQKLLPQADQIVASFARAK
jgi:hypothetical protein